MSGVARLALAAAAALILGACPGGTPAKGSGIVERCVADGQRCRIGGSKLGVCTGQPDGRFECMSQN
ncbi:MAG: hypothetical protein U1F43_28155 [Myxococcota bacterium]